MILIEKKEKTSLCKCELVSGGSEHVERWFYETDE